MARISTPELLAGAALGTKSCQGGPLLRELVTTYENDAVACQAEHNRPFAVHNRDLNRRLFSPSTASSTVAHRPPALPVEGDCNGSRVRTIEERKQAVQSADMSQMSGSLDQLARVPRCLRVLEKLWSNPDL